MFLALTLQTKYGSDGDIVDDYYKMYNETLVNNLDEVTYIINQIKQVWVPQTQQISVERCTYKVCSYFVELTGLTASDFYIYNTFIDQITDNMISTVDGNVPTMGFSLTILANFPNAFDAYIELQKVAYQVQATGNFNEYIAMTFAGYYGYQMLSHANAHAAVGLTQDFGAQYEVPEYEEETFYNQMRLGILKTQQGHDSAFYRLLQFCQDSVNGAYDNLYDYILPYKGSIGYSQNKLISYLEYQHSDLNGQYTCDENSDYKKTTNATNTIFNVQTSLRYNETTYLDSDYRMIQQERNFNSSSINEESTPSQIYNTLAIYPSRQSTTLAIVSVAEGQVDEKVKYETCASVYDASNSVVSCVSKPPPESAASIACSWIIIVATIAFWIWGCYYDVKYTKMEKAQSIDDVE